MKPRLRSAPATDEDLDVFNLRIIFHGRCNFRNRCDAISIAADRRDANLMLAWCQGWPIDVGWDDELDQHLAWYGPIKHAKRFV